ncbi:peptide chain release factor N(5)-glutamine methyltransferase [Porphyrobacter sp. GA68]|uniref:peptide chain release factor N(5)-glutamine methyltransferase n=1 Tax=Porphyrobacter sp. GA68 TaxID=2883480 RepID=UPI001D17FA66|nr:peptide chain release factor N(5)-glutamine methyltransferase [Porphyrobacter sp. GA68]
MGDRRAAAEEREPAAEQLMVADAIRAAAATLAATSDTPRLDAELLMAHAMGVSRSDLLLRLVREPAPQGYSRLVERRAAHEPVAYITGEAEFWGLPFRVTPATLIPRADSETLIRAALALAPEAQRVLDLGTGTGALLLTYLAETRTTGVGIDASEGACAVASDNAARLGLSARAAILQRDWTRAGWRDDLGTFDLILCNPPYVEEGARLDPQVGDYEPASALFAGADGLDDYRLLIPELAMLMDASAAAILEIGAAQAEPVAALAGRVGFTTRLCRDLAGRPRALVLRR